MREKSQEVRLKKARAPAYPQLTSDEKTPHTCRRAKGLAEEPNMSAATLRQTNCNGCCPVHASVKVTIDDALSPANILELRKELGRRAYDNCLARAALAQWEASAAVDGRAAPAAP